MPAGIEGKWWSRPRPREEESLRSNATGLGKRHTLRMAPGVFPRDYDWRCGSWVPKEKEQLTDRPAAEGAGPKDTENEPEREKV